MMRAFLLCIVCGILCGCATSVPAPSDQREAETEVHSFSDVDKMPEIVKTSYSNYVRESDEANVYVALFEIVISNNGAISTSRVVKTTDLGFAEASLAKLPEWGFLPARKAGRRVACQTFLLIRAIAGHAQSTAGITFYCEYGSQINTEKWIRANGDSMN